MIWVKYSCCDWNASNRTINITDLWILSSVWLMTTLWARHRLEFSNILQFSGWFWEDFTKFFYFSLNRPKKTSTERKTTEVSSSSSWTTRHVHFTSLPMVTSFSKLSLRFTRMLTTSSSLFLSQCADLNTFTSINWQPTACMLPFQ